MTTALNTTGVPPSIGIIGAGRVGSGLARTWSAAGVRVVAVASRTFDHARALAEAVGAVAATQAADVVRMADLTVICVPDDAIAETVTPLAAVAWAGRGVVHTSGAQGIGSLSALAAAGAMTGSLHPAYPFASGLPAGVPRGVTFAVESDHPVLSGWLAALVTAAEGRTLTLRPDMKPLYHAALVMSSNYAVTLYAASRDILRAAGADEITADATLMPLLAGMLDNLRVQTPDAALTGPLVRGDVGTITAHLAALAPWPEIRAAYLALARLTLPLVARRGGDIDAIRHVLDDWEGP